MACYVLNRSDCKVFMSVTLMRSWLAIMPVLKGIQDLPDSPNQPTN